MGKGREALQGARQQVQEETRRYAGGTERPVEGYGALLAAYGAATAVLAIALRKRLPERVDAADVALLGAATFKLSRVIARDPVTSPMRMPFTEFESEGGPSEVNERPRKDSPWRHAVGELLTCPFCVGQWVATGFAAGLVLAPRATRLVAATMSAVAVSDGLHLVYARPKGDG